MLSDVMFDSFWSIDYEVQVALRVSDLPGSSELEANTPARPPIKIEAGQFSFDGFEKLERGERAAIWFCERRSELIRSRHFDYREKIGKASPPLLSAVSTYSYGDFAVWRGRSPYNNPRRVVQRETYPWRLSCACRGDFGGVQQQ
jgi:hypothetical protein